MFTSIDKAIVAAVMAILWIVEQVNGWTLGIGEEAVSAIIAVLTPIIVWLWPNRAT